MKVDIKQVMENGKLHVKVAFKKLHYGKKSENCS